jgi:hypothetical protein
VLDNRIWPWEDQPFVAVVEADEVWRPSVRTTHLDDLAYPVVLSHDVAMHVQAVSYRSAHIASLAGASIRRSHLTADRPARKDPEPSGRGEPAGRIR